MKHPTVLVWAAAAGLFASAGNAFAATIPVTDWHTFRATTATVLSGQGTDDPVVGSVATTSTNAFVIGYFPALPLNNVGDKIIFTFGVSFNDGAGVATTTPDQFRFALYNTNGETLTTADNTATAGNTDTDGYKGYWFGVKSGSTGAQGSIRKRTGTTADTNTFANASATLLGTAGGTSVSYAGQVNGTGTAVLYTGVMTLEVTAVGTVQLSGSFSGNGGANSFSFTDSSTPLTGNYNAVGFLNGSALSADQMIFQDVSVVPEPAAAGLLVVGALMRCARRRHCA